MLTHYLQGNEQVPYIATITSCVRVVHPQLGTQRLAITDMYGHQAPVGDGRVFEFDEAAGYRYLGYPVLLHVIDRPCFKARREVAPGRSVVDYVPFAFRSGAR